MIYWYFLKSQNKGLHRSDRPFCMILGKVKACGVCGTDLHIHDGEFGARVENTVSMSDWWLTDIVSSCSGS
jgi:hypothetical protein